MSIALKAHNINIQPRRVDGWGREYVKKYSRTRPLCCFNQHIEPGQLSRHRVNEIGISLPYFKRPPIQLSMGIFVEGAPPSFDTRVIKYGRWSRKVHPNLHNVTFCIVTPFLISQNPRERVCSIYSPSLLSLFPLRYHGL